MAQGKYLPYAVDWRFLVHLRDTPTPCKRRGCTRRLLSRGFHSPLTGRAGLWVMGLSPWWGCATHASTKALIIVPYLSLQTFCALRGHVCVTAERCQCWWGCDYGLCFAWRGTDVVLAEGQPKETALGRDSEVQHVGWGLWLGCALVHKLGNL